MSLAFTAVLCSSQVQAQQLFPTKLPAPPSDTEGLFSNQYFGATAAIENSTAVVGRTGNSPAGPGPGEAMVFTRQSGRWGFLQKLVHSEAGPNDLFGNSIGISGDIILVGAPYADLTNPVVSTRREGKLFIFSRTGNMWTEMPNPTISPSPFNHGLFGRTVAIEGNHILVGEPGGGDVPGKVHAFTVDTNGATFTQTIDAPDVQNGDGFGYTIALSGNFAVLGSSGYYSSYPTPTSTSNTTGRVYVYKLSGDTWAPYSPNPVIDDPNPTIQGWFGNTVAMYGNTIAISKVNNINTSDGKDHIGRVYLFDVDNTVPPLPLDSPHATEQEEFGFALAIDDERLLIGTPWFGNAPQSPGTVYQYKKSGSTWVYDSELVPVDVTVNDHYGHALAMDGNEILVCAPQDSDIAPKAGSVYIWDLLGNSGVTPYNSALSTNFGSLYTLVPPSVSLAPWTLHLSGGTDSHVFYVMAQPAASPSVDLPLAMLQIQDGGAFLIDISTMPYTETGVFGHDGNGILNLVIPQNATLIGLEFELQWLSTNSFGGYILSNGLRVVVCP